MKIAAIVVKYHTPSDDIIRLRKNLHQHLPNSKLFIVDNTARNLGYAKGLNKGIKQAVKDGYSYFMLINPDIHFTSLSERTVDEAWRHFHIFGGVMKQHGVSYYGGIIDPMTMSGGLSDKKSEGTDGVHIPSDFVSGSCLFVSKAALNTIGYLMEDYFLYYEDVEYCRRAQLLGLRIGISTDIRYTHTENSTKLLEKEYYLTRNRLHFLFTYGSLVKKLHEVILFVRFCITYLSNRSNENKQKLRGYIDFIRLHKKYGKTR